MASAARRVLITGAGSGIGQGMARILSTTGAKHGVIVTDLNIAAAEKAAEEIVKEGGNVIGAYSLDVCKLASIRDLMDKLGSNTPEVLVNNVS